MTPSLFPACLSRRSWLQTAAASLFGIGTSNWVVPALARAAQGRKPKACILLFMNGGASQHHTFTLPEKDGQYAAIDTAVPGIRISEHLPRLAAQMKDWVLIRSMSTGQPDHAVGLELMHTGYTPSTVQHPALGNMASEQLSEESFELPSFITINGIGTPGQGFVSRPAYLPPRNAPVDIPSPDKAMDNLASSLTTAQLADAVQLLEAGNRRFQAEQRVASAGLQQAAYEKALRLMRSPRVKAFDIQQETAAVRERYGATDFGKGCLLARRLVEVGVPFVEVVFNGWDDHGDGVAARKIKERSPVMDAAMAALVAELKERGLFDSTLVVWMSEFGRTPQFGPGRDSSLGGGHWAKAWTTALAGGGIKAGQAIGQVDARGAEPTEGPVSAQDFLATLCSVLDIDHTKEYETKEGRPMSFLKRSARPVAGLI
jgi:uncharacterized protein (DUF1501 family)